MRLSLIVPMLNEATELPELLAHLQTLRGAHCEVLLVDGGSSDESPTLAQQAGVAVLVAPRGRACQMNAGARATRGEALLFLHADSRLPPGALRHVERALDGGSQWGRFDVQLDSDAPTLRLVGWMINLRSRLTGIATGDQALFARRDVFEQVGGFPNQPLMEDIELSRRLRAIGRPACVRERVLTSARRWESRGVWRTIFMMWLLRFAYWCGASPDSLAEHYR